MNKKTTYCHTQDTYSIDIKKEQEQKQRNEEINAKAQQPSVLPTANELHGFSKLTLFFVKT